MYSQDGMGLGHLRRSSSIAGEVLRRDPTCEILILADSPAASLTATAHGMDFIKLPTVVKMGSESWKESAWNTFLLAGDMKRTIRLRTKLILDAFEEFHPDAVLVDHMPVGALGELKPLLEIAVRRRRPPRLYLGLRDILDTPGTIRRAWSELGAYDYLCAYEKVLVYGVRELHDSTAAYALASGAREIVYCHYVTRPAQAVNRGRVRSEPYLLLTGGGGHDAFPVAKAFLGSISILSRELQMDAVVVTGPTMSPMHRDELLKHAAPSVEIYNCVDGADTWIRDAEAVVTLGGYNSLCEVLAAGKKAVVIPRSGPSAEQITRARLFAERGLLRTLDAAELSASLLSANLLELLADDSVPNKNNLPPLDGAANAARLLLGAVPHASDDPNGATRRKQLAGVFSGASSNGSRGSGDGSL